MNSNDKPRFIMTTREYLRLRNMTRQMVFEVKDQAQLEAIRALVLSFKAEKGKRTVATTVK